MMTPKRVKADEDTFEAIMQEKRRRAAARRIAEEREERGWALNTSSEALVVEFQNPVGFDAETTRLACEAVGARRTRCAVFCAAGADFKHKALDEGWTVIGAYDLDAVFAAMRTYGVTKLALVRPACAIPPFPRGLTKLCVDVEVRPGVRYPAQLEHLEVVTNELGDIQNLQKLNTLNLIGLSSVGGDTDLGLDLDLKRGLWPELRELRCEGSLVAELVNHLERPESVAVTILWSPKHGATHLFPRKLRGAVIKTGAYMCSLDLVCAALSAPFPVRVEA